MPVLTSGSNCSTKIGRFRTKGAVPAAALITRKPILPSEEELSVNSRSKSAKLRVFERAGEA